MPVESIVAAVLILSVAAFVQSVSGFGLALVATAAMPLVMPLREVVSLVAVFNLFVSAVTLWHNRAEFSWKEAWPILTCMCVGIPVGFFFFHAVDGTLLIRILGGVLVAIALFDLRFSPSRDYRLPRWSVVPLGVTGGVVGGAFNVGGPPIVAYVYSQNWEKSRNVAVLQTVFLAGGLTRNALMGSAGDYSRTLFLLLAFSAIPGALAIAFGKKMLERIPKEKLRTGVFIFVLLMGTKYLVFGS
jgi:uncharacterized membrane protein YfcA